MPVTNILSRISFPGDANYSAASTEKILITSDRLTADRTWTLPQANSLAEGSTFRVEDINGVLDSAEKILIAPFSGDIIDGSAAPFELNTQYQIRSFQVDSSTSWRSYADPVPVHRRHGGVPYGGATGQFLTKLSNTSFDTSWASISGGAGGTVTGLSAGNLSPLFTTSVAASSTVPTLTFALSNAPAHTYFGNNAGSVTTPNFFQIGYSELSGTPTIPIGADPTASVGLLAVNGSASTFFRSDGAPALDQSIAPTWTGQHTWIFSDSATNTVTNILTIGHNTSATPLASYGTSIKFQGKDSTTNNQDMAQISSVWASPTHATPSSYLKIAVIDSGSNILTDKAVFSAGGGLHVGNISQFPPSGIISAYNGFRLNNTVPTAGLFMQSDGGQFVQSNMTLPRNPSTSGKILQHDGSNIIFSTPTYPTTAGTSGNVITSDGTNFTSTAPTKPWDFVSADNSSIDVANTNYQTVVSQSVTIAANDTIIVDIWGTLLNNSGNARVYSHQLNIGSVACIDFAEAGTTGAAHASDHAIYTLRFVISISATNAWRAIQTMAQHQNVIATNSPNGGYNQLQVWNSGTDNLTGSQAVSYKMKSNNATATQTFKLHSYAIRRVAKNP